MSIQLPVGAMSGALVIRHREVLRERVGDGPVRAALGALPSETSQAILRVNHGDWVPIETVEALFLAVGTQLRRDPVALHAEVLEIAIDQMIQSVWRVVLRLTSDTQLVAQAASLYAKALNRGILAAKIVEPRRATLELTSWPAAPESVLQGVRIGITKVLGLAGRKGVQLTCERVTGGARYVATWT